MVTLLLKIVFVISMSLGPHEKIRYLLDKYRLGICNPDELQQLFQWLEEKAEQGPGFSYSSEDEKARLRNRMHVALLEDMAADTGQVQDKPPPVPTWQAKKSRFHTGRRMLLTSAVAAGLLMAVALTWLYQANTGSKTFASAPGQVRKLVLPDSSVVWLNNNSAIVYNSHHFTAAREVAISRGEAFFEVRPDAQHPFIVHSSYLHTVVLGTSFSVKLIAGGDMDKMAEDIKISVRTGKVLVQGQRDTVAILHPLQRLRFTGNSGKTTIDSILDSEAAGWTRGELLLENAGLKEVIQLLQDHFSVKIINEHHTYAGEYYLQVKSDISLLQLVKILNLLGQKNHVQFTLQNQMITIH